MGVLSLEHLGVEMQRFQEDVVHGHRGDTGFQPVILGPLP